MTSGGTTPSSFLDAVAASRLAASTEGELPEVHAWRRTFSRSEVYVAFSGEAEHPEPGEVIFADSAGQAHARRWTHRQSASSAVRDGTTTVLIVAEAMHRSAPADIRELTAAIADALEAIWSATPKTAILSHGPVPTILLEAA